MKALYVYRTSVNGETWLFNVRDERLFIVVSLSGGKHVIKDSSTFQTIDSSWSLNYAKRKMVKLLRK